MDEANLHPAGHEIGEAPHDRLEECPVRIFRVAGLGVVPVDRVIGKAAQVLRIAARREILKRAHPQMARCHACQHAARQHALTHDAFAAKDCR